MLYEKPLENMNYEVIFFLEPSLFLTFREFYVQDQKRSEKFSYNLL